MRFALEGELEKAVLNVESWRKDSCQKVQFSKKQSIDTSRIKLSCHAMFERAPIVHVLSHSNFHSSSTDQQRLDRPL